MLRLSFECKRHPTYKAMRAPAGKRWCAACQFMWALSPDSMGKLTRIEKPVVPGLKTRRRK